MKRAALITYRSTQFSIRISMICETHVVNAGT